MNIFDRFEAGFDRGVAALSQRFRHFAHFWRALERFIDVSGGRLAAAISYYAFFAAFSLAVVAYSILGRVLGTGDGGFLGTVNDYLTAQLSWVEKTASQVGTQEVTVLGSVALLVTGVGWVDSMRSSSRAVWGLDQHPGHWIIRWLVDSVMLLLMGLLLLLSLAMTWAIDHILDAAAGPSTGAIGQAVLRGSGPVLQFAVNFVLSAALLTLVPRLRLSARRLLPIAIIVALGIQLLNSLGRWYIDRLDDRPAYQLVTGAVGLLIYLYLLNQLILFGCALAATSTKGTMTDHSVSLRGSSAVLDNSAAQDSDQQQPGEPRGDTPGQPR